MSDPSWTTIDPVLHRIQAEHDVRAEQQMEKHFESFTFGPSPNQNVAFLPPPAQTYHQRSFSDLSEWGAVQDCSRSQRYQSPNGHYGGNLSESSSDYTISPDHNSYPIAFSRASTSTSLLFTPSPIEDHFGPQHLWCSQPTLMSTNVTLIDDSISGPYILGEEKIEFQCPSAFDLDSSLRDDSGMTNLQLPISAPEELDLSDSIATLTSSCRTNTFSSQASETEGSEIDADHDSDPDFCPLRKTTIRQNAPGHTRGRSFSSIRPVSFGNETRAVMGVNSRVHKPVRRRSSINKDKVKPKFVAKSQPPKSTARANKAVKSFPCVFHHFGCTTVFASKNEWRRHVNHQHLRLGFYRCDLGGCNPINVNHNDIFDNKQKRKHGGQDQKEDFEFAYNEFFRKDLFTQHCRRMHGPQRYSTDNTTVTNQQINVRRQSIVNGRPKMTKTTITREDEAAFEVELEEIRQRCWHFSRHAPTRSWCGFCSRVFETEPQASVGSDINAHNDNDDGTQSKAWEERMEHVGRHYERDSCSPHMERLDNDLLDWGLSVGLLEYIIDAEGEQKAWLVGFECPNPTLANIKLGKDKEPRSLRLRQQRLSGNKIKIEKTLIKEEHDMMDEDDCSSENE